MLKLQELRAMKNLTQKELAEKIRVKNYIIANWEQGRTEPSLKDLIDLADFFECSIDYLLGRENDFGQIILLNEVPKEYNELLNLFYNLPKEKKQLVVSLIKNLQ